MPNAFHAHESDWPHPACFEESRLMREVDASQGRTGGPGGQHRNKVETQVVLTHTPTGVVGQAGERRSVKENKPIALRRLRLNLATEHRIGVPLGEIGSRLWRARRREPKRGPGQAPAAWGRFDARIECNPAHWDYPALLAEAMDVLGAAEWDPKTAALRLEVSTSQLVKLVQEHAPAWAALNAERSRRGLRKLR